MPVYSVGAMHTRFIGLSSDEKPMDVEEGTQYLTANTGEKWFFFDGMWVLQRQTAAIPLRILADE